MLGIVCFFNVAILTFLIMLIIVHKRIKSCNEYNTILRKVENLVLGISVLCLVMEFEVIIEIISRLEYSAGFFNFFKAIMIAELSDGDIKLLYVLISLPFFTVLSYFFMLNWYINRIEMYKENLEVINSDLRIELKLKENRIKDINTAIRSMSDVNAGSLGSLNISVSAISNRDKDDSISIYNDLEEKNILIDQTVMKINHLIKSPMSGVAFCLQDIENSGVDDEIQKKINRIKVHLETIEDNLNSLKRDVGIIEDDKMISIGEEIKKRLEISLLSSTKNLHLKFNCDTSVLIKGRKFKNVMTTIGCVMENAIFFSKDNGIIKVDITENQDVQIKITNYGSHIEEPDRIFTAGYSSKGTSGIGLYIAREIIEKMGGSISGKNLDMEIPNTGVEFTITFPVFSTKLYEDENKNDLEWLVDI